MKHLLVAVVAAIMMTGCSVKRMAANAVGDAISGGGGVWSSDNDPDLVREALPFALKTNESLLEAVPDHEGLLESTAFGFTAYAFLLQQEADRLEAKDRAASRQLHARASNLYIRGRDYALTGLELRYPGFSASLRSDRDATLARTKQRDVSLLYWTGVAWAGALGAARSNTRLMVEFPTAGALVQRSLELDPAWDDGAADEFLITYEASRPGGSLAAARAHYRSALELSGGKRASVHLALAEAVSVQEQNVREFRRLLKAASDVDADAVEELRLANTIAKRRAAWLRTRIPDLFLVAN